MAIRHLLLRQHIRMWANLSLLLGAMGLFTLHPATASMPTSNTTKLHYTTNQQNTCSAGKGGLIVEGNWAGDPESLNPLFASSTQATRITSFLFPTFIGINPESGNFEPEQENALAMGWSISDDRKVYTFQLRDDWYWNDGTPITSADIQYSWDAIHSSVVDTPLTYLQDFISEVETPDPYTVVIHFKNNDCSALNYANLPVVPAHVLPDFAALSVAAYNQHLDVTAGSFKFGSFEPGESITLVQESASNLSCTQAEGFRYQNAADQNAMVDAFLAGETNVIDNPPINRWAELDTDPDVNVYRFPGNTWDYLALNDADPNQAPEEEQKPHPLFGDVRVRQAIAKAINVDAIIQAVLFGEGTRMPSLTLPTSWAFDRTLAPIAYDMETAKSLLDDAGWIDDDGQPETPRIANGAPYAPDGMPFSFVIYTNTGGSRREIAAAMIQAQLGQVGVAVDVQSIDLASLQDHLNHGTFDAALLGWRNSYPDNPDQAQLFSSEGGSNSTSYHNPDLDSLMEQARTLPGCDTAARAQLYGQIQAILQQDLPYIPLYALNELYAARTTVSGFAPFPNQLYWNIASWNVPSP